MGPSEVLEEAEGQVRSSWEGPTMTFFSDPTKPLYIDGC